MVSISLVNTIPLFCSCCYQQCSLCHRPDLSAVKKLECLCSFCQIRTCAASRELTDLIPQTFSSDACRGCVSRQLGRTLCFASPNHQRQDSNFIRTTHCTLWITLSCTTLFDICIELNVGSATSHVPHHPLEHACHTSPCC